MNEAHQNGKCPTALLSTWTKVFMYCYFL